MQIVFCMQSTAQDVSSANINWGSILTYDLGTSRTIDEDTQVKTYSGDSIQWVAANGAIKYSFKISKVNGTWADVSQPGLMVYEVVNNNLRVWCG